MNSKTLSAAIAAVVLTAGIGFAVAASAVPSHETQPSVAAAEFGAAAFDAVDEEVGAGPREGRRGFGPGMGHRAHRGPLARRMMALRIAKDPALATIRDLRAIEGVYRRSGRDKDVPGFYNDVLKRTDNALVRDFATHRLARIAMRSGDTKGALEQLQRSLDEDLKRLR